MPGDLWPWRSRPGWGAPARPGEGRDQAATVHAGGALLEVEQLRVGFPVRSGLVRRTGAVVRAVPPEERLATLARVDGLARRFPAAAVAALRVLPRLHEEAPADEVARWFVAGETIAEENEAAGTAFFALESRTSWSVLHAASTAARRRAISSSPIIKFNFRPATSNSIKSPSRVNARGPPI